MATSNLVKSTLFMMTFSAPAFGASIDEGSSDRECLIPFKEMEFKAADAHNNFEIPEQYRDRYLVADLNTVEMGKDGRMHCRGVSEIYPDLNRIPELSKAWVKKNYQDQVQRFAQKPVTKKPIVEWERTYCIGQRVSVCEIQKARWGRSGAKLIARFISATKSDTTHGGIYEGYYSPINFVQTRFWSSDRAYTEADRNRDNETGGSEGSRIAHFEDRLEMPNFMNFGAVGNYAFQEGNGLHQKMSAEGQVLQDFMGSPISLGCIRLENFAAKFLRWYLPIGARLFIYFQLPNYRSAPP